MSPRAVDQFTGRAAELGVRVTPVKTSGELSETVAAIAAERSWCAWTDPLVDPIRPKGARAAPAQADVSIVRADVGIAETGTVGLVHGAGRPRAVALLPPTQIVLLESSQVVDSVGEALGRFFSVEGTVPSNLVFVTGPSRTADIELRQLTGVHSPKEIDVVILNVVERDDVEHD